MRASLKNKIVLDTSVLVEYIIKKSEYRKLIEDIFNNAIKGELELFVNPITLSETLYVASRIYKIAKVPDPNDEALNYITWLRTKTKVININEDIFINAGELKKKLHIALADCYVIATALNINATPLFKKCKKEMESILSMLKKLGVVFLEELASGTNS